MPHQSSNIGLSYNYRPWLQPPSIPNQVELETAQTLINLGSSLQHVEPPILECPPSTKHDDAMDKIVGKLDSSKCVTLNRKDAMDLIISTDPDPRLDVETEKDVSVLDDIFLTDNQNLDVETSHPLPTKPCCVKLKRLESILFDEEPPIDPAKTIKLEPGEHFTRSKLRPKPTRSTRRPRTASSGKSYSEPLLSDDDKAPVKQKHTPLVLDHQNPGWLHKMQKLNIWINIYHPSKRLPLTRTWKILWRKRLNYPPNLKRALAQKHLCW